jgi:hypothetical protein
VRLFAACLMLFGAEALADAAIKAQEGSIDHWIEYYAKQRAGAAPVTGPAPSAQGGEAPAAGQADRKAPAAPAPAR